MRSHARLLLALPLLAAQAPTSEQSGLARATAGNGQASAYDRVGSARVGRGEAITAAHAALPLGSVAEVTALDSGRIILVQITARPDTTGAEIELSAAAARALGLPDQGGPVRVRSIQASAADLAALRAGNSASPRLPAPEVLLQALRRGLTASQTARAPAPKPRAAPPRPVRSAAAVRQAAAAPQGRFRVQVAALADEQRARAVARDLNGQVERAGSLWRIRLGPFADRARAQRARDAAIARGYGGASIISAP
ncbi:SPOR domain-containing protein [Sphingomonas sp.]|uniref:SPOR domain-containing protein n=1 Tax=Sphingomonas sp. TaxID=28214 RepID=UPI0035C7C106